MPTKTKIARSPRRTKKAAQQPGTKPVIITLDALEVTSTLGMACSRIRSGMTDILDGTRLAAPNWAEIVLRGLTELDRARRLLEERHQQILRAAAEVQS